MDKYKRKHWYLIPVSTPFPFGPCTWVLFLNYANTTCIIFCLLKTSKYMPNVSAWKIKPSLFFKVSFILFNVKCWCFSWAYYIQCPIMMIKSRNTVSLPRLSGICSKSEWCLLSYDNSMIGNEKKKKKGFMILRCLFI